MLTREGFIAVDMSGQSLLRRSSSSWNKAEAIRRGDLKISGPIPITEDMPLNEEEEKQFAQTGSFSPVVEHHPDPQAEPVQRPPTPQNPPPPIPVSAPVAVPPENVRHSNPLRSNPLDASITTGEPSINEMPQEPSAQPPSYKSPTPMRSTPESATLAAQKRKRKSGLRNVFRKMFGRKSRDEEDLHDETDHQRNSQNPTESAMPQSPLPTQRQANQPRISDLPVKELKPLHPLGQHLPFPMNVNAPQASPPGEYLTFSKPDLGRRRATLPSLLDGGSQRHSLDDPRIRLSTWEERPENGPEDSPRIGIALSSPLHPPTSLQSKRRSRSADALRDLAKDRSSMDRRRSAEIRYWRDSYASGSIYSRPQTAKTQATIHDVHAQEPSFQEGEAEAVTEMSATLVAADEPETPEFQDVDNESVHERQVHAPVSAFNFGVLKSAFSDEESPAPEPHEEILAAAVPNHNRLSIEDRVHHLEAKFEDLEFSMRRLSTRENRQTIILENAPRTLRSRDRSASSRSVSASRSRSNTQVHQDSDRASGYGTTDTGPPSPLPMRPATAVTSEDKDKALIKMYEALKYERTARKALEQQVRTLQRDVFDLHTVVDKLIASATATSPTYPTPSPDMVMTSMEERESTPRAKRSKSFSRPSYEPMKSEVRESVISKFSQSETDTASESGPYGTGQAKIPEGLASPDIWATPKEEAFNSSGFFHTREKRSRDNLAGYI